MMKDVVLNTAHFSKPKIFENLQENTGGRVLLVKMHEISRQLQKSLKHSLVDSVLIDN